MATAPMSDVIRHLRRAALLQDAGGLTDGQLLERFVARREEAAFAALVRRHGPMVLGVCRRLLNNSHDAEDAFQATFLVLVRKAASILPRERVGNWLYGVAYHAALKARTAAARRRARERKAATMPRQAPPTDLWESLRPLLDQELHRLPDKYRAPVILCDLEGKTRKEAARQLGWPEGTVAGRLARARQLLARRLSRRGFTLTAGSLASALSWSTASACVPGPLFAATVRAGLAVAAGGAAAGVISAQVALVTEGVMKTMLLTKLKLASVALAVAGALGTCGLAYQLQAQQMAPQPAAQPKSPWHADWMQRNQPEREPAASPFRELLRRYNQDLEAAARREWQRGYEQALRDHGGDRAAGQNLSNCQVCHTTGRGLPRDLPTQPAAADVRDYVRWLRQVKPDRKTQLELLEEIEKTLQELKNDLKGPPGQPSPKQPGQSSPKRGS